MRTFCVLIVCLVASAQNSFVDRLTGATDDKAVAQLLDANTASINPELFEACRKAAQAHLDKREQPEALRGFAAALAVARRLQSDRSIAISLRGIGIVQRRLGQNQEGLATYKEGLAAAVKSGDRALEADLLRGLAGAQRSLGDFQGAIETDNRSVALYRDLHDDRKTAESLTNLAVNYERNGELRRAQDILGEALQVGAAYPEAVAGANAVLAVIAAMLGNAEASLGYLEQTNRGAEQAHDWHSLAIGLTDTALAYAGTGQSDKALAAYNRALDLAGLTHDPRVQSIVLLNRAALYSDMHQLQKAIADLEQSLRLARDLNAVDATLTALVNLSWIEIELGQVDDACQKARQAVDAAASYGMPDILWQVFDAMGRCSLEKKDWPAARKSLEQSVAYVEGLRSGASGGAQEGQHLLESRIAPYHDLLRLDLEEGSAERAFSVAERARARQLLDVMRSGRTEPAASITAEEAERERRFNDSLAGLDVRIAGTTDEKALADLHRRLEATEREMEAFRMKLYALHPALAAQRGEGDPITLAQCADLVPDSHTTLVEFVSARDRVYVFTIARGASGAPLLRTDEIPWNRDDLTRDIESFREKLARRDLSYREAGGRLYRRLLAPFGSELRRARLLVIAPDGPLWNLPFQALIDGNGRYLIETHAVFYAPSLTWLRGQSRLAVPSGSHRLLAMGDPDTAAAPDTARQVQELARFYGAANSKVLLGADASRTNWQQEAPNFRILHLATHAIFNSANPMYSYLVFSGKTDSDKVLEARDVLKMNLHSDLVVLSACETGRGRVSMGEGLVGMTWAFLLAGARTTVVSQWKADSASTTQLMIAMHGFLAPALADGPMYGRARSLQKAALAVMRTPEYSHPFYWAGFVMVGNGY